MIKRLCLLAVFLASPAYASNYFFRMDPNTWVPYSVTKSVIPDTKAPDGSYVYSWLVGAVRGSVGPLGYNGAPPYTTAIYVDPNGADTLSIFYKFLGGDHPAAHLCMDKYVTGATIHQCLDFNAQTGTFLAAAPAITSYSIVPLTGAPGWFRIEIAFKTSPAIAGDTQAFPYVQANPGQHFALWRGQLVTGQAP